MAGERIGLVGASTPDLPSITTTGGLQVAGSTSDISELAAAIQPTVDNLIAQGINKIILLTHMQQIDIDRTLAGLMSGVDIIVAGGSNTRMGDATDTLFPGDTAFTEPYPFSTTDADGSPILIVNIDGDYKYLGRLVVTFDVFGTLLTDTIDEDISGAWASTSTNANAVGGTAIPEVVEMRDAVLGVIEVQFNNVIGHTDVFIEGRRSRVRTEETNLGNLTADSMKWYAEQCNELASESVLALKNGGGIRAEIGDVVVTGTVTEFFPPFNDGLDVDPGDVSEGHLRGTLRFDNGAVVFDVTGEPSSSSCSSTRSPRRRRAPRPVSSHRWAASPLASIPPARRSCSTSMTTTTSWASRRRATAFRTSTSTPTATERRTRRCTSVAWPRPRPRRRTRS